MAKTTTLSAAFEHFGTFPRNPRWAWSAVSPDQQTVALALWEHDVGTDGSIDYFGTPDEVEVWRTHGNRDRIRNLKIARDNCGGMFYVVWVKARDMNEFPRKIVDRYPDDSTMMKLVDLDEETGAFSAARVETRV